MNRTNFFAISLILVLFSLSFVIAEETNLKASELNSRYNHFSCQVEFLKGQSTLLSEFVTTTPNTDVLTSDLAQLKSYADSGDIMKFNEYMIDTFSRNIRMISSQMKTSRASFDVKKLTNAQKISLRDNWNIIRDTYSKCDSGTRRNLVEARKTIIDEDIDKWNIEMESMKAKGLDTSKMESVLDDARELSGLLDDALKLSTESEFKAKINEINDMRLHIWARYNIERLRSYIIKIEANPLSSEYSDKLTNIKSLIDNAESLAAPGKNYGDGEFTTTWNNIKQAQDGLISIVNDWKAKTAEQNKE